ncbi:hypothetical protein CPB83DRAFT_892902 [Crepidotus variabilis]|uniref:Uncharacterized protein n=1 Tax=Crepidotus variabilis TaxID=179855 RepID=A0A9P6EJP8_9AGAR|nr:hypothetical protein CPB83DRAFT_892902 [Crepidotus variabilis]
MARYLLAIISTYLGHEITHDDERPRHPGYGLITSCVFFDVEHTHTPTTSTTTLGNQLLILIDVVLQRMMTWESISPPSLALHRYLLILDILLITGSVIIFGSTVSPVQVFGYSIALGGLVLFKTTGGK